MKHILIVDDSKTNLIMARQELKEEYEVTPVISGEQALQEQKIGRGTELLLGAAVNVYRFHSNPSNSSKF